jgi:pimeloyl-ACP methyl ester carboxylesterase
MEHRPPLPSFAFVMLDLLDLFLLRRGIPSDDRTLAFRRIDGEPTSRVIYFLPWNTPFYVAWHAGFTPLEFLACYEMPPAIVSSAPELSVEAMHRLIDDAESVLAAHGIRNGDAIIVGLSVGTYPATYLANRIGARLCAVAAADRADLMLWQSPAARLVKRRCLQRGLDLSHCSKVLAGFHPVQNLAALAPDSTFVVGDRDPFIPPRRSKGLLRAIQRHASSARVVKLKAGHVKTMIASAPYQRAMLGLEPYPARWQLLMPSMSQLQLRLSRPDDPT